MAKVREDRPFSKPHAPKEVLDCAIFGRATDATEEHYAQIICEFAQLLHSPQKNIQPHVSGAE
jgi:hypothetical protein